LEIRVTFHKKLREIQNDVLAMGSMIEQAISRSIEALKERHLAKARQIIIYDKKVNEVRFTIEENCAKSSPPNSQ
jgi:phosphate transport system protein